MSNPNARAPKADPLAAERATAAEAAKHIRYSERVPIPVGKGQKPRFEEHVIAGAHGNDFTIPYDPATMKDTVWRGFVICEDRLGCRYVPVQLTYAQLLAVWRDEPLAWDTRASQAERIERELTSDVFTLRQGCWAERSPREQFSIWAKRRADGDRAPGHYMSHIIRTKLTPATVREVFAELAFAGFLGALVPGDAQRLTDALLSQLTVV